MSCHSTDANVAILGYCAAAYTVDATTVESEFHWLKKTGRDKSPAAPEDERWQDFLDQQARWVAHDERLTAVRRARIAERIAAAREQVPDATTFYALEHLPSRLAYVTDPGTVRGTLRRVQERTDALGKSGASGIDPVTLREIALDLRRAEACLTHTPMPAADDLPVGAEDTVDEVMDCVETIDAYLVSPHGAPHQATAEHVYQAHRWIASAYRRLRRPAPTA